jgi:hypothetical protein
MVFVWLIFTLMLFLVEPLVLRRQLNNAPDRDPARTFKRMQRMHWILLSISLVAVAGAVAGSHGWMISGQ